MVTAHDYESIMTRLREEMPSLADQLEQEVRHGRAVTEKELRQEGRYEERASRLAATELPALGKNDVAVIPYTDEERVELIREALVTLAETMYATRQTALKTAMGCGTELEIHFGDPELEVPSRIDLREETERARMVLQTVRELLIENPETHSGATR
ncbi:hypothetical protein AAW14_11940 [Streptomyces hygroscopicus]|uniref:hypothetical protein n=1 Tax=Streptomyces hygroscopicus TaxID=1912 RepID=UPI00223EE50A|nr:hypothetical protein [Streptomyces hygroscopicus]MCW7942728.1 hypothetical protein [Streptomyces hygroscopicus]